MAAPAAREVRSAPAPRAPRRPGPRLLPGWGWAILAALATTVAILGRDSAALAVAAATVAVLAAAVTVATALGPWQPRAAVARVPALLSVDSIRAAFRSGPLGRESLVDVLDRLERLILRPNLPVRTPEEAGRIVHAPEAEFLRYLASRLDEIEGST